MAGINDFLSIQASNSKINRNEELKKPTLKKNDPSGDKVANAVDRKDQAQISDTARNLLSLRMDAKKYLEDVKQGESLSENEIDQLKQKIENKYFVSDVVIDKIVDKLVDLPNFLNTPFKT